MDPMTTVEDFLNERQQCIEELMDKYHVTHVHVACGPMEEVKPNEVV